MTVSETILQHNPNGLTESDFDVQVLDEDAFPDLEDY
jgi:hypothetical protein